MPTCQGAAADDPPQALDALRASVEIKANAAGIKARAAAWTLITMAAESHNPQQARVLLESARDLLEEMYRWKDNWSSTTVDRDRKVREAMVRSEDCAAHGEEIAALRSQLHLLDQAQQRTENGRIALLGMLYAIREFVTAQQTRGVAVPDPRKIIAWLATAEKKTSAAHQRAFNPPRPTPGKKAGSA
jgi:hypothetical protein